MIDFRYHLISLIAVFLALGLGILMGSVVLDDAIVKRLEHNVDELSKANEENRARVSELNDRLDDLQRFTTEAETRLTQSALVGETLFIVTFEGTDDELLASLRRSIEAASGEVASTLTLTNQFALTQEEEMAELRRIVTSLGTTADAVRRDAADQLGQRLASSVTRRGEPRGPGPADPVEPLLDELQQEGYARVDGAQDSALVPLGSLVLVAGGGPGDGPVPWDTFTLSLGTALSDRGIPVLVAEALDSEWGIVDLIRDHGDASGQVATVDNVDTAEGRIATVLGLEAAEGGDVSHYGSRAERVLPEVSPGG